MPGLVRKLLIYATAQGLLLQPVGNRGQSANSPPIIIEWNTHRIAPSLKDHDQDKTGEAIESHGLLGLFRLSTSAWLVSVTKRQQVAQINGRPVFAITDVTFIPLASQQDAQSSINAAVRSTREHKSGSSDIDTDDETDDDQTSATGTDDGHDTLPPTPGISSGSLDGKAEPSNSAQGGTTIAADVIKDRGRYGRFAERWFSKSGWTASGRETLGMSRSHDDLNAEQKRQGLAAPPEQDVPQEHQALPEAALAELSEQQCGDISNIKASASVLHTGGETSIANSLAPRILKTLRIWLSSKSFYFSYDYDLSRRLATQENTVSTIPLHKRFDALYFWNKHLAEPLLEAEQHGLILPVIQGFVGQRAFTVSKTPKGETDKIVDGTQELGELFELVDRTQVDSDRSTSDKSDITKDSSRDFLVTLISRRSVKRAGLRYLRRGVDDSGNVANNVETEQLLSDQTWNPEAKIFSLVQVRGSIPVFFSQSPYSFKPIPIMYGSDTTAHDAFNRHFRNLMTRYGKVQIASLIDKHGTEKPIGDLYQKHVEMTNDGDLPSHGFPGRPVSKDKRPLAFTWFDFHHECRGMNFQNVSYLLDCLSKSLDSYGWTEAAQSQVVKTQSGIVRTNCMDCLDRTNVVQSAIAGKILQDQLASFDLSIDLSTDPKTQWFNTMWADNGDAVSRQYAGTAALKGDYTRTRKRNWTGAINDFSLTLGRYYNNIFSDYFLQTTIDYTLGHGDERIWEEFESDMMTSDYALDMSRVRQGAVERCVKVILGREPEEAASSTNGESSGTSTTLHHDDEDLISGWTLQTPSQANSIKAQPLEECVLLLTDAALYAVRFDWHTEKVGSYERVPLEDIVGIKRGVYITSTLGTRNVDEERNVGFVVSYKARSESEGRVRRVNTRSLSSSISTAAKSGVSASAEGPTTQSERAEQTAQAQNVAQTDFASTTADQDDDLKSSSTATQTSQPPETKMLAFKALPTQTGRHEPSSTLSPRSTTRGTGQAATSSPRVGQPSSSSGPNSSNPTTHPGLSERDSVHEITTELYKAYSRLLGAVHDSSGDSKDDASTVHNYTTLDSDQGGQTRAAKDAGEQWQIVEGDVVSLSEARKATSYFESLGYSLRRLVWA